MLLIVNTATGCGFTPHYEPLEAMYKELKDQGFEILDFPCNQFANQAPGSDDEIHQFCTLKFGTEFPQFAKIDVNGETADPLFAFLATEKPFEGFGKGLKNAALNKFADMNNKQFGDKAYIKWNFTKFLIDREGRVIARFEPTVDMKDVRAPSPPHYKTAEGENETGMSRVQEAEAGIATQSSREKTIVKTSIIGIVANVFLAGLQGGGRPDDQLHRHRAGRGQQHLRRGQLPDHHRRDEAGRQGAGQEASLRLRAHRIPERHDHLRDRAVRGHHVLSWNPSSRSSIRRRRITTPSP